MILTKGDQQLVYFDPVLWWKYFSERHLGLIRSPGFDVTPAVADPVHVGINTDSGLSETKRDHQVSRFAPYPFELQQLIDLRRHTAAMLRNQLSGYCEYLCSLVTVESSRINQRLDLGDGESRHGQRCSGTREQARRRSGGNFVFCTQRNKTGYQNLVRAVVALRHNRNSRRLPGLVFFAQN